MGVQPPFFDLIKAGANINQSQPFFTFFFSRFQYILERGPNYLFLFRVTSIINQTYRRGAGIVFLQKGHQGGQFLQPIKITRVSPFSAIALTKGSLLFSPRGAEITRDPLQVGSLLRSALETLKALMPGTISILSSLT